MLDLKGRRNFFSVTILSLFLYLLASCGASGSITYKPTFLPVKFSIDTSGSISVQVESPDLETLIGTFSIGASAEASIQPQDGTLLVTIRHLQEGSVVDSVYRIQTGQDKVTVKVNGETTIQISNNSVTIDATASNVQSIDVTNADGDTSLISTDTPTPTSIPPTPTPIPTPIPPTPTPTPVPPTPMPTPTPIPPTPTAAPPSITNIGGNYAGTMRNSMYGTYAKMTLIVQQDQGNISGYLTIYPPLAPGSGPISGSTGTDAQDHTYIQFSSRFTVQYGTGMCGTVCTLDFQGTLYTDGSLRGAYSIEEDNETGVWSVIK